MHRIAVGVRSMLRHVCADHTAAHDDDGVRHFDGVAPGADEMVDGREQVQQAAVLADDFASEVRCPV